MHATSEDQDNPWPQQANNSPIIESDRTGQGRRIKINTYLMRILKEKKTKIYLITSFID